MSTRSNWILIVGSTTKTESTWLYQQTKKLMAGGVIVEIGSFLGKSTIALASGSKEGNQVKVYAIDPHLGDWTINKQFSGPTYNQFLRNLKQAKVGNIVVPIKKTSSRAIKSWKRPISLLFVDGDHSYRAVSFDIKYWGGWVVPGGLIILHDVLNPGLGPSLAIMRQIVNNKNFSNMGVKGSMFYAWKLPPKTLTSWINWYFWAGIMRLMVSLIKTKNFWVQQYVLKRWLKRLLNWLS